MAALGAREAVKLHLLGVRLGHVVFRDDAVHVQQRPPAARGGHGDSSSTRGRLELCDSRLDRLSEVVARNKNKRAKPVVLNRAYNPFFETTDGDVTLLALRPCLAVSHYCVSGVRASREEAISLDCFVRQPDILSRGKHSAPPSPLKESNGPTSSLLSMASS